MITLMEDDDEAFELARRVLEKSGIEVRRASAMPPMPGRVDFVSKQIVAKHKLSPREADTLRLLLIGYDNEEIPRLLGVKLTTIKSHVSKILAKTNTRRRNELMREILEAE